jgi:hypothetical protein
MQKRWRYVGSSDPVFSATAQSDVFFFVFAFRL